MLHFGAYQIIANLKPGADNRNGYERVAETLGFRHAMWAEKHYFLKPGEQLPEELPPGAPNKTDVFTKAGAASILPNGTFLDHADVQERIKRKS